MKIGSKSKKYKKGGGKMNVFELFATISIDTDEFERKVDSSKKRYGELGKSAEETAKAVESSGKSNNDAASDTETLANKLKVLAAMYERSVLSVASLSRAFNESVEKTGAASDETIILADKLSKAERESESLKSSLDRTNNALDGTDDSADAAGCSIDGFIGKMQSAITKGELMAKTIEGILGVLGDVASWVVNLDSATEDYRIAQGKLNTAFQAAGHRAKEAEETYQEFYKILGDTDTATEASQLLAKLADNQQEMQKWTKISVGVYGTFGDSLPIEGLIEASNETAKVGQVTGVLADALNWAGINEEAFNERLAVCSDESQRNQLIMETLSETYNKASEEFYANNEQLIKHRENELALQESTGKLGEAMGDFKDNILAKLAPNFINAAEKGVDFIEKIGRTFEETGIAKTFGDILDSAIMLLDPLADLVEIILPALAAALKPVASYMALITDTADAIIGIMPWSWGSGKFSTAMGWNVSRGELSHQQQLYYKDELKSSVYDPTIGAWVGNGATTVNNYNMNVDAKNVREFNDMVSIAQNQRIATRMGVS